MLKNIKSIIANPTVLILVWIAFLLSPLLSYFRFVLLNSGSVLSVGIKGFSSVLYYLPVAVNVFFLGILLFWFFEFVKGRTQKLNGSVFAFVTITTALFLLGTMYLRNLETANYPNFVYSHYGITVAQLEFMSFICLFEMVVFGTFYFFSIEFRELVSTLGKKATVVQGATNVSLYEKTAQMIAMLVILCMVTLSIQSFIVWPSMLSEAGQGYESKVGKEYKYIEILVESTAENSKIIHPPQGGRWPAIGNQPLIRYFLFPRTLISGALIDNQGFAESLGEAFFAEMVAQDNGTIWPAIDQSTSTAIFNESNPVKYDQLEKVFESEKGIVYKISF